MSSNYIRKKQLKIAMIGHKVVPSRRGGIELVLTTMCPKMVKRGHQVTCYNRSGDKVENEYVNTVKNGTYKGVKLKKVLTINKQEGAGSNDILLFCCYQSSIWKI